VLSSSFPLITINDIAFLFFYLFVKSLVFLNREGKEVGLAIAVAWWEMVWSFKITSKNYMVCAITLIVWVYTHYLKHSSPIGLIYLFLFI
jgi:hypothetical protein